MPVQWNVYVFISKAWYVNKCGTILNCGLGETSLAFKMLKFYSLQKKKKNHSMILPNYSLSHLEVFLLPAF